MYKFGKRSLEKLNTVHPFLQEVLYASILVSPIDFAITHGMRSEKEQFELYKKGRKLKNGRWVIHDKRKVVTYVDGTRKKSKHNYFPSLAFDFAPIVNRKLDFNNMNAYCILIGVFFSQAKELGIDIKSGITFRSNIWKGFDAGHIQLESKSKPLTFEVKNTTINKNVSKKMNFWERLFGK